MAKVMVSLPDELLARLDRHARASGTTRSGLLQRLADRELAGAERGRRRRITQLLADPGRFGGSGAQAIREDRRSR